MSSSQIFTIGTALRRAEDNGISVEVLVQGQWLTGSIAGLDGDGLVLVTPERIQCVVRNSDISVVRLLAGLPQDEAPTEPREAPYENVVRDPSPRADHDAEDTAQVWVMPAVESTPAYEIEHDHDEVFALDATLDDEGPLELSAPVAIEEADDEPTDEQFDRAGEPTDEERTVFALPAATSQDGTPEDGTREDGAADEAETSLHAENLEDVTPEPEPEGEREAPGSATTGEEWRDMLIALRAEAPTVSATPAPERRRSRRLVMR